MTDNKVLFWTIIGCCVAATVWNNANQIKECFGMLPPQVVRIEKVHGAPNTPLKGDMFMIPGQYQAMVQPRQAGMVDYGPNLRYNMPDKSMRADSMGSLGPQQVKESFCCGTPVEGYAGEKAPVPSDSLAVPAPVAANELGELTQPIVYDRFIAANKKSALVEGADFIRGDLPIIPISKGWFAPSANPQTDLRQGALSMIGGANNQTSKDLEALQMAAMNNIEAPPQASSMFGGNEIPTYAASNYNIQNNISTTAAGGDIRVTRFP